MILFWCRHVANPNSSSEFGPERVTFGSGSGSVLEFGFGFEFGFRVRVRVRVRFLEFEFGFGFGIHSPNYHDFWCLIGCPCVFRNVNRE